MRKNSMMFLLHLITTNTQIWQVNNNEIWGCEILGVILIAPRLQKYYCSSMDPELTRVQAQ